MLILSRIIIILVTFSTTLAKSFETQMSHFGGSMVSSSKAHESRVLKAVVFKGLEGLRKSAHFFATGSKKVGNTIANIGVIGKMLGALGKLVASKIIMFRNILNKPKGPHQRMPSFLNRRMREISPILSPLSTLAELFGEAIIFAGDAFEDMCSSLGKSLEDSFTGLDHLICSLQNTVG